MGTVASSETSDTITMSRTVGQLKDGVAGLLTGVNLNNVTGLNNALERAFRTMLQKASVPEASTAEIVTFYDGVYNYPAPEFIFGGALRDIRPIGVSRNIEDYVYRKSIEVFDRTKAILPNGYQVTFETENGISFMRVAQVKAPKRITLDSMTSTTGWSVSSGTGLTADQTVFYQSPASLRFNISGVSSAYLAKTLTSSLDLSDYEGVGVVFLALDTPSAVNLASIQLRIGSDANNYSYLTVTEGFLGSWPANDFVLVAFDLSQASTTGTPDYSAIDTLRVTFTPLTNQVTLANVRVGDLFIALPSPHKIFYESTGVFQNTSGVLSNFISLDSDLVLLNDAAYNIYEHEAAISVAIQMGGKLASGTIATLSGLLNGARAKNGQVLTAGLYDLYKAANPAEEIKSIGNYYDDP